MNPVLVLELGILEFVSLRSRIRFFLRLTLSSFFETLFKRPFKCSIDILHLKHICPLTSTHENVVIGCTFHQRIFLFLIWNELVFVLRRVLKSDWLYVSEILNYSNTFIFFPLARELNNIVLRWEKFSLVHYSK